MLWECFDILLHNFFSEQQSGFWGPLHFYGCLCLLLLLWQPLKVRCQGFNFCSSSSSTIFLADSCCAQWNCNPLRLYSLTTASFCLLANLLLEGDQEIYLSFSGKVGVSVHCSTLKGVYLHCLISSFNANTPKYEIGFFFPLLLLIYIEQYIFSPLAWNCGTQC